MDVEMSDNSDINAWRMVLISESHDSSLGHDLLLMFTPVAERSV